jgi:peptide/nickel transport system permease protein
MIWSLTLPAITIGLYLAPILLRTLRSSLIETLNAEFIEAARARGLSERRVVMKHVMRNSLIAMITVLGVNIGFLISGTVVVETVFALPGLGSLLVSSILARDFPVITALTLVFGIAVILVNLLTDLTYAALDPRVRL